MSDYDAMIEEALATCHLPTLLCALVHVTGNIEHLREEWRPRYSPTSRFDIGVAADEQERIRDFARPLVADLVAGRRTVDATLPPDAIHRMMSFVAGVDVPESYLAFLTDEIALDGTSSKDPRWASAADREVARAMHVLVVGAGMSGLLAGIRLKQAGIPFTIVEKNADVGGTWLENRYPGCRVDSSNHMYSYSFEPNHHWPQHFSTQPVLLDYFRGIAAKHGLVEHIRFNTAVEAMTFDEKRGIWRIAAKTGSERRDIEASAVIVAVGQLNQPKMPDIAGIDSFAGEAFHSACWPDEVDLAGKRVGVIGTGASAFQFIPEVVRIADSVEVFQRTPAWLLPLPEHHADVAEGIKWTMEHVPFYAKWYRFWLIWINTDGLLPAMRVDPGWDDGGRSISALNRDVREMFVEEMMRQVADRPDLAAKIIPSYPVGSKRALIDNGLWVETLKRPNVTLTTDPISHATAAGIVTADGLEHRFDMLIYGSGFHATRFLWPMTITGRGGVSLADQWAGDPRAYLGITTPGFPNFFMLYGPNTNIVVNGSIVFFSEAAMRYVVGCLKLLAERDATTIEVRRDVHDRFNDRIDAANAQMAWGVGDVSSWYRNASGRVTQNWPFSLLDYWRETLAPDPDDFVLRPRQVAAPLQAEAYST